MKISVPVNGDAPRWDKMYQDGYGRYVPNYAHQVGASKYSLTRPVKSNGEPTRYFQLLQTLSAGPLSRKQMLLAAGYHSWQANTESYGCGTFSALTACDLIRYNRKTNTYMYGNCYGEWYRQYVAKEEY